MDKLKNKFIDTLKGVGKGYLTGGIPGAIVNGVSANIKKPTTPATSTTSKWNYIAPGANAAVTAQANKPTTTPVAGNQSATTPTSSTNKPSLSTSGQQYTQQLYDNKTGARTEYGASMGVQDMMGGKAVNNENSQTPTTQTPQVDPYKKYLDSLFDTDKLKTAQGNVDELNNRTSAEILRNRKREDELRKNDIGQLERGQQYQMGEEQRLSNKSLADLAIAKGASLDTINQIMAAGKESYEMGQPINVGGVLYQKGADGSYTPLTGTEKESFDLSEGESRYEFNSETGQYEQIASKAKTYAPGTGGSGYGGGSGTLSALAQAVQNGTISLDKLTPTERGKVAAELSSAGIPSGRQETLTANLGVVNSLLSNPNLKSISGFVEGKLKLGNLNPNAQLALNQFNQLKGILSLENREKLKGSGAISDFEFKVLSDAATALGRNLSDTDFKTQLEEIKNVFNNKYAYTRMGYTGAQSNQQTSTSSSGGGDPLGIR